MPENRCPSCGVPLPDHALGGHCPRCLMLQGLDSDPPSLDRGSNRQTLDLNAGPTSVLETIGATIGDVPRVMLRDTAVGETPSPLIRPSGGHDVSTRYRIDGEIARGGMGAILKGRDPDLGRDVAIKVLREDLRDNDNLVRRFVEEAQIGGQLQHPGVVPIYELGTFADHRPFFCMKLVKGQTLADLLGTRSAPTDDLHRFLGIFAAIAQTMAYAHTRGVIHRDLKPSNVMVGSFGEVQVMDWGLAKVLARGGIVNDASAGKERPPETMIATARSGSGLDLSQAGSILGTPSYMPPEQARGEAERIDERADVFALGSILTEILTGWPAFKGRSSVEILRKSANGETTEALEQLDACGAEGELIALARNCLAVEPEDRPRDANVVANRITAYLAGVQERVQAAERERAVAVATAVEERRRRKVQLALAASVLALTTLGGLSTAYYFQQQAERTRRRIEQDAATDRIVGQAETLYNQARQNPEDLSRWQVALTAVKQAEAAGDSGAAPRLLDLHTRIQAGLGAAERDRTLIDRVIEIRLAEADDPDGSITDREYTRAFRNADIDFDTLKPAEAGARIKARPPSVAMALVAALDHWGGKLRKKESNPVSARPRALREAVGIADPDPWRNEMRSRLLDSFILVDLQQSALLDLARTARLDELGPISLHALGAALRDMGRSGEAESVLRKGQERYPRDLWINYELARTLVDRNLDEAIRFYSAARAIRPETAHALADCLDDRGDTDESIAIHREVNALRPGKAPVLFCLGRLLKAKGLAREADEVLEAARAAQREADRLNPARAAKAHVDGIIQLAMEDKFEEIIAKLRAAKQIDPSIRASYHFSNSNYVKSGTLDQVIAENNVYLGHAKRAQGKLDEAAAAYREAISHQPDLAKAYSALVLTLSTQGRLDEAVAAYREATRLKPEDAPGHLILGGILRAKGDFAGSLEMTRRGHELGSKQTGWNYPSEKWVAAAEQRVALADRLDAIVKGKATPKDNAERLALAAMCYETQRFAAAARFTIEALESDPKLDNGRAPDHRQNAAGYALLAGLGQGIDDPRPDPDTRNRLRAQARNQFRADLVRYAKQLELHDLMPVMRAYMYWEGSSDVAGARDPDFWAKLPEHERKKRQRFHAPMVDAGLWAKLSGPEQKEWRALWAEFEALQQLRDVDVHVMLGRSEWAESKLDVAIDDFREAIRLGPDFAEIHYGLGNALRRRGKLDEAITEYRETVRLQPDFAEAHFGLGIALADRGKRDAAIDSLREAIRLRPEYAQAHCKLGNALSGQGKRDESIASYREAIRLKPNDSEAYSKLAGALKSRGDDAASLEMYRKWRELNSKATNYWLHPPADRRSQALEWLKAERDDWSKRMSGGEPNVKAQLVKAVLPWTVETNLAGVRNPESLAKLPEPERKEWQSLWGDIGGLLEKAQGRPARSPSAPIQAQAAKPALSPNAVMEQQLLRLRGAMRRGLDTAEAHNSIAWLLATYPPLKNADPNQALVHVRKAIELEPKQWPFFNTLGFVEYRLGHLPEARSAIETSRKLRGDNDNVFDWLILAMIDARQGRKEQARDWYDRSIASIKKDNVTAPDLMLLWSEAAEMLGIPGPRKPPGRDEPSAVPLAPR